MKDFLLVFKYIYKNSHAKQTGMNGKKKMSSSMTFILSCLPLVILICAALAFLTISINDIYVLANLIGVVVFGAQITVIFLSVSMILNTLYSSRDIAILNSLPINQTSIFFAKLLICYLDVLSLMSSIAIPAMLTLIITFNVVNGFIFYGIYPLMIIINLIAPLLPLFVIVLFSMPLNYIGTFFKGKSNVKSILSLIVYTLLIGLYMVFVYYMNTSGFGQNGAVGIDNSTNNILFTISKIMYPNYVLVLYSLGIDFGKNFGISFAITIGMIIVLLLLANIFYKKINQKNLDFHVKESNKVNVAYKQNGIVKSLVIRDFKLVFRNQFVTLQSLANVILTPIFIVVMYFISINKPVESGTPDAVFVFLNIGFFVLYSLIFLCGTNMLAAIAYTREGESFNITKNLPISAKDSILSKLIVSIIPCFIIVFIDAFIGLFLYKIDIISILVLCICLFIAIIGSSSLHIYFDIKKGNIHWVTNQDLKQVSGANTGTLLSVFSMMIPAFIMFGLGFILAFSIPNIIVCKVIYWSVCFVLCLIIGIIGPLVLFKKGILLYNNIGDNKFIKKNKKDHNNNKLL